MKFIVSFLFSVFLTLPVLATVTPETTCTNKTDQPSCNGTAGCYWYYACLQCNSGYECQNGSVTQCDFLSTSHPDATTPAGASSCADDWICTGGKVRSGDSCVDSCNVEEPKYLPSGAGCDDWLCRSPYYKNGNDCAACPTGSATTGDVATNISQCNCPQNYYKHYTNSPTFDYCFTCGTGAHYDSGTGSCVCDNQYANGTWTDNNGLRTYSCTCPQNSTAVSGVCTCDGDNYYMTGTTDNYSCASCGTGEITQNGNCICDERHYGSHGHCDLCPSGTKVATLGTTTTNADCRAHSDTKFCDANGQNCMKLLQ